MTNFSCELRLSTILADCRTSKRNDHQAHERSANSRFFSRYQAVFAPDSSIFAGRRSVCKLLNYFLAGIYFCTESDHVWLRKLMNLVHRSPPKT
ncbi:hypothetical protein DSM3645_21227 [Blastopirellula marina DSM 3645]|uniref:Uncharacterized protein n=1 Tax=Blastopirellula marina DSM 3645 TaxID=314230 RepID=A3ZR42_9BACT|nr:hypothetical protein DSM3645_21227 [Blastopirellula marina DSM 3645]